MGMSKPTVVVAAVKRFSKTIIIEAHSKAGTGILAGGQWYNFSRASGLTATSVPVGAEVKISGEEGGKADAPSFFIDAIEVVTPAKDAPVDSPQARVVDKNDRREASIITQAVIKSLLEGPLLSLHLVGGERTLEDVLEDTARRVLAVHDKLVKERLDA